VQVADQGGADHGTMLSRQAEPVQHAVRRVARKTSNRPQTAALAQKRQRFEHRGARASQRLEDRMFILAECVSARCAVEATLHAVEDPDVAGSHDPIVGASRAVAPLPSGFHGVSPPSDEDTPGGRSRPVIDCTPVQHSRLTDTLPMLACSENTGLPFTALCRLRIFGFVRGGRPSRPPQIFMGSGEILRMS
jgi:hypothetical protein